MLRRSIFAIVLIGVLLGLNYLVSTQIDSYYISVILHAGIFVILAVSLNLVNGFTGQFSLGQAGFYGIGAYAAAALTTYGQITVFRHWFNADGSIDELTTPIIGRDNNGVIGPGCIVLRNSLDAILGIWNLGNSTLFPQ